MALHASEESDAFRKRCRVSSAPFMDEGKAPIDQEKPICSFDILPDECLFEILQRLYGIKERSVSACVSKRWLMLLSSIRSPETSRSDGSLDSSGSGDGEDGGKLVAACEGHLTRCLKHEEATDIRLAAMAVGIAGNGGLDELAIRGSNKSRGVTDIGLSAIAHCCPFLRVLSLWDVPSVSDKGLSEIANGCHDLERLSLYKCPMVSDKGLVAIARSSPLLKSLILESCSQIRNDGFRAIGSSCPNLRFVSIGKCVLVGDQGVANLIVPASSSLRKIVLDGLGISDLSLAVLGYYGKAITDVVLSDLHNVTEKGFWVMGSALGLQNLKSLTINSCQGVTDVGLEAIAKGSPGLKQLYLHKCSYLSDAGLKSFVEATIAFESLQLEECCQITLDGILGALLHCQAKLESLCLGKCFGIKDLGSCPPLLPRCISLRSLAIRECPGFSNSSLAMVGQIFPNLQKFELSKLIGLTDAGLVPLLENLDPGLLEVNLSGCVDLTDGIISALLQRHGTTLQMLHLDGCSKITDCSLVSVANSCHNLVDLDMSECGVTDYGVAVLASARQLNLQVLCFSGCTKMTQRSLPFFGNMGRSLVGLNLQQCHLIGKCEIQSLEEKLWWCDILS